MCTFLGISVEQESKEHYNKFIYHSCYVALFQLEKGASNSVKNISQESIIIRSVNIFNAVG